MKVRELVLLGGAVAGAYSLGQITHSMLAGFIGLLVLLAIAGVVEKTRRAS